MKNILYFLTLVMSSLVFAQKSTAALEEIKKFQQNLDESYRSKDTPLRGSNKEKFIKHPFFPIDFRYRVVAKVEKTKDPISFPMMTSSGTPRMYQEYAKVYFEIDGKTYYLSLYQSLDLMQTVEYKDYLFLPFKDLTNGKETYGGGKYLDVTIPQADTILIDFNQSYQPYCAYTANLFSCPIVPEENHLPIEIRAGVMYEDIWFD